MGGHKMQALSCPNNIKRQDFLNSGLRLAKASFQPHCTTPLTVFKGRAINAHAYFKNELHL